MNVILLKKVVSKGTEQRPEQMWTTCEPKIIESGNARTKVEEATSHHLLVAMKPFELMWNSRLTLSITNGVSNVTRMKRYERPDRGNGEAGRGAQKNGNQATGHKTKIGTAVMAVI